MLKRYLVVVIAVVFSMNFVFASFAETNTPVKNEVDVIGLKAKSVLLMDGLSGNILIEKNANERLSIASMTKIMTMLLVIEAVDKGKISLQDMVGVSDHTYSMGGSQVYLKPGEMFTVEDMLKAVAIHSANDASVALAEFLYGSEGVFVARMNERAKALGMKDTHFLDATGLTDEGHYSTARDVAIMSRELMQKHPKVIEYTKVWLDYFRDGKFMLTNTNLLVKSYKGAIGLKTGYTEKAGYCLASAAKRDDTLLIGVVMGLPTDNDRVSESKKLLDYGFANYEYYDVAKKGTDVGVAPVKKGLKFEVPGIVSKDFRSLIKRNENEKIVRQVNLKEDLVAPIKKGDVIGEAVYKLNNNEIAKIPVTAKDDVEKASIMRLFWRMVLGWFGVKY